MAAPMGFNQNMANILNNPTQDDMTLEKLQHHNAKRVKVICAFLRNPGGLIAGVAVAGADPNDLFLY